jgi:putative ABC transport system ATP-binding protein
MSEMILETEKIEKTYKIDDRQLRALSDVNLQVKRGDFISIMGPSGSGKTTLLNILGCLDRPTQGKVVLDGVDVTKIPEKKLYTVRRDKVGFIFQTFNLMPYLNAVENVELPMEGTKKSKDERRSRSCELLRMVGLSEREEHRPYRLSAGEQQRVAIARALANNPAIVLADEPTGNLDGKTKFEIVDLLKKLNAEHETTIIMVSHDNQIASYAERVFLLSDGKLQKMEKKGLAVAENEIACPHCGRTLLRDAKFCSHCGQKL